MRIELDYNSLFRRNRKLLLNFRQMAVLRQPVSFRALVSLAVGVRQIRFLSGPGNTAVRIYHYVLFTDSALAHKRQKRHENARRVAAGAGDELVGLRHGEEFGNNVFAEL